MRILLIGEFSGFHNNLKKGLEVLGHQVVIASSGDGFKNIETDINLGGCDPSIIGKAKRIIYPFLCLNKFKGFDIIQFVNTNPFTVTTLNKLLYKLILEKNTRKFVSACGDDPVFFDNLSKFKYHPYKIIGNEKPNYPKEYKSKTYKQIHDIVIDRTDGVIPVMYEYALGYKNHPKIKRTIPLPIHVKCIDAPENIVKGKVHFLHGLSREFFKGTTFISAALNKLKNNYPNDVKVTIAGNMPQADFLEVLKTSNVVLDQCKSYSYGMNALYAMSFNKIVMSGSEPEALQELNIDTCPIVNIVPDERQIYESLKIILETKNLIINQGNMSRMYVEEYHDSIKIANEYLKLWNE